MGWDISGLGLSLCVDIFRECFLCFLTLYSFTHSPFNNYLKHQSIKDICIFSSFWIVCSHVWGILWILIARSWVYITHHDMIMIMIMSNCSSIFKCMRNHVNSHNTIFWTISVYKDIQYFIIYIYMSIIISYCNIWISREVLIEILNVEVNVISLY